MAVMTRNVSGNVITYTFTDAVGAQATVVLDPSPTTGHTVRLGGSAVLGDAQQAISTLLQLVATDLVP